MEGLSVSDISLLSVDQGGTEKLTAVSMTTASTTARQAFSYCVHQVRKYDYANYLCLLHLPPEVRKAAFVLRAFNVETAKVGDSVREPQLGVMRLVWWKEAVDGIYKKASPLEHPVVQALTSVISEQRLSKQWFSRLIESRMSDLEMTAPPFSMAEVERYAENTASVLLYLTLEAAGIRNTSADHAASHIGKAAGIGLLLRGTPVHGSRRRTYIPVDLATKYGLSQEDIYRGENREALADAVHEVASFAHAHLKHARELAGTVPKEAKIVLLPAVPAGVLLQSLEKCNFNVFDGRFQSGVYGVNPLWMQLLQRWHAFKGTY
ncbi:hypothetical protein R1flu_006925 [Riccia fluitans]|uniref:15-cis-phytoene synthase n=1 Tax=Riccia fluitans TaxID=41844 RepID=A0ABD1YXD6_9MARC